MRPAASASRNNPLAVHPAVGVIRLTPLSMNIPRLLALLLFGALSAGTAHAASAQRPVSFEKLTLTSEYWCDGVNAADINGDGKMDIVAGPFWYAGPDFKTRHAFYEPVQQELEKNPTNSMFSFIADFNGDGRPDILVLGRVLHHQAFWYENPGAAEATKPDARWKKHFVANRVFGEAPLFRDIDGDGKPELISISGETAADKVKQWGWYAPNWAEPTKPWKFVPVTAKAEFNHYYHGEGVGDINGDGRADLVLNEGWWEQPPKNSPPGTLWKKHAFTFSSDRGGAQILVTDVNGDGKADIVTALNAHGWGLAWFEQTRSASGEISFLEHKMMGTREEEKKYGVAFSQPHALTLASQRPLIGARHPPASRSQRARLGDPARARAPPRPQLDQPQDRRHGGHHRREPGARSRGATTSRLLGKWCSLERLSLARHGRSLRAPAPA